MPSSCRRPGVVLAFVCSIFVKDFTVVGYIYWDQLTASSFAASVFQTEASACFKYAHFVWIYVLKCV
jgi:hypothetical protein